MSSLTSLPNNTHAPHAPGAAAPVDAFAAGLGHAGVELAEPEFLGQRPRPRWVSLAIRVSVPAAIVVLWWLATSQGWVSKQILASPGAVWGAFNEVRRTGELSRDVLASLQRVSIGLGIGIPVGLLLGVLAGLTPTGEETIDPTMQMFRAIPSLALIPLFIAWFGIDEKFKIVLIAVAGALPIYAYAYLGVRSVDRKIVEAARGFGLRGFRLSREVILPSALANIFMALRLCLVISMTALIAGEGIGTEKGIGYLVLEARQFARTDYTMLCIVLYALIGLFFDLIIRVLEHFAMPWRKYTAVRG